MNIACQNITVEWQQHGTPRISAFSPITVDFPAGSVSLITGPTGGGKSTLLHILAGLLRPTSGIVTADGDVVSRWPAPLRDRWRRQVGICFQHLHLPQGLTVMDAILQPLIPRGLTWGALFRDAQAAVKSLDLEALSETPIRWLSGGQQQRAALARAVVHHPRLLLLDEPTAFQDDAHIRDLLRLMAALSHQGVCVVVSSHDDRLVTDGAFQARYRLAHGKLESLR